MVTVYFELPKEKVMSTSKYFNNSYEDEWLDEWAKLVIEKIDHSELVSAGMVQSPVLGPITIREISAGSKALIMMKCDKTAIINANSCGDNCAEYIAALSLKEDFSIYLSYPMNFRGLDIDMKIADSGIKCHNADEFEKEYLRWRHNMTL